MFDVFCDALHKEGPDMDRAQIILMLEKKVSGFQALASSDDYPDEIGINVRPEDFKGACLALHKVLASPVMALFAVDEREKRGVFVISCVFLSIEKKQWVTVATDLPQEKASFDSLAKEVYSASLFEREIREMFGIEPKGNPDVRRLHLHDEVWPEGDHPLRKDFRKTASEKFGEYRFNRVDGEGIFEVPVGPVHAGIIGPGHFRFSVAGEPIINLEARLGFTHRGAEKLFEGKSCFEAVRLSECVSGDSAFAHSLAFTMAAEKISGVSVSAKTSYIREVFLELERMYNHVNDIGGMAVDVGFSFPAAYASIIKEAILQVNETLSGSRYLKNVNTVGGIRAEIGPEKKKALSEAIKKIGRDFIELEKILHSSVSFMDRVDTTGILRLKTAEDFGAVGLCARASGIPMDLRSLFSAEHKEAGFVPAVEQAGDVLARLKVRISEFKESGRLIERFLEKISYGARPAVPGAAETRTKAAQALGYAEGWRGPVLYWLKTDASGSIERCKIVDPSFHNWQALTYAVLGNIIPDFPLCNKSFDLSYSGNDL
jgi:Ni,Fe-hydrogenase III large subunit/Ni,Fe-hydrogenase III component G